MRSDCGGPSLQEVVGLDDALHRHEPALRSHAHEVVEVRVDVQVLTVAALVAAVHVDQRDVEGRAPASRRAPRRRRRARSRFAGARLTRITSEPSPTRVGRNGTRHAAACNPRRNMPSSSSVVLTAPDCRALRKCGSSGIESSDTNAYTTCCTLPARAEQTDVGAAVRDDRQVLHSRAAQRAHEGHRLAPRSPSADADGHAVANLADDVVDGDAFVGNRQRVAPRGRAGF